MRTNTSHLGFALVISLITIVLLTIMAVAFLTSSSLEQVTARAIANKTKADLAARTAVNIAIARLIDNLSTYSDSATTWEKIYQSGGSVQFQGTTLYYRDKSPDATAGGAAALHALPLISGAIPVPIPTTPQTPAQRESNLRGALPTDGNAALDDTNSYDLNHTRFSGDIQGGIGAPTGATTRPEFRGQWVNQTDADNTVTSRYAYWMEDESFKANVNLMGITPRGSTTLGDNPSQIVLQGLFKALGVSDFDGASNAIFSSRSSFPGGLFFEYPSLDQAAPTKVADAAKFEATIFSGASNLSRSGSKRVNLNKVVADSTDGTAIRTQLDQIVTAISYHLPNFAQRFYRTGTDKNTLDVADSGSPDDRTIYLNKIGANIRDYIDTDSQPTIVNDDFSVAIGAPPEHSVPGGGDSGPNAIIAIGKDSIPFLQEYMLRVKQIEPKLRSLRSGTANYNIEIDHYLEFWNMTNQDITVSSLGANPFIRIGNQFAWTSYGGTDIPESSNRDFSIPLTLFKNASGDDLVFKAGMATVLTTDPVPLPPTLAGVDASRVFRPPAGTPAVNFRVYTGTCKAKTSESYPHLDSQPRPVNTSNSGDLWTEITLGNDKGVLESFGAPTVWYITVNADDGTQTRETVRTDTTKYYFRASSLKGNSPSYNPIPSQLGDPRTNNEQLSLDSSSTVADDQTNYKTELGKNVPPSPTNADASLTNLNSFYVSSNLWSDPAVNTADAAHAPMVIANAPLISMGQLGDVFDPARVIGTGSGSIRNSRGGGRTLRIGQPDDLWDGNSDSASREWTSWRLADVFTTSALVQLDGRININGVGRDGGVALKAVLYGYAFQPTPQSDAQIAGITLGDQEVQNLIDELEARITNDPTAFPQFASTAGPFFERGEVSEMPLFNTGNKLTGTDMSTVYDRGREELFRRMAELITTRGNIFTVYAVGQSLVPQPAGSTTQPVVTAGSQLKITFRVDPVWNGGTPSDPFDPTTNSRFNKPDKYAIKILYAGE